MLRFKNTRTGSEVFMVVKSGGYTVGRKDCSIKIEGDQSISRKHATLTVSHPLENVGHPDWLPSLELKDSSKYGTVVNGNKIAPGSSASLKPGDNVTFGALNSNSWRVGYQPLVAACSGLPGKDKVALKKTLSELGGHLVADWSESCTLLVMKQVNVTAKVIGALVTCHHIVTPTYLKEYLDAAISDGETILPDPSRFLPPVMERAINQDSALFEVKEERRTMLQGKTFVFLSEKQHKRLHAVIELAGGKTVLYTSGGCSQDLLRDSQTCVLQSEVADNTQTPGTLSKDVVGLLKRNKLRLIAEAELGLAVLTVSTDVYCNPAVPKEGLKLVNCMKQSQAGNLSTQRVLAADTQQSEVPPSPGNGKPFGRTSGSRDKVVTDSFASPAPPKQNNPPSSTSKKQHEQQLSTRSRYQDITDSLASPAAPKQHHPSSSTSKKQHEQHSLPPSSGVSLFSRSGASESNLSEDPFVEPISRDSKRMKRPLSDEDVPRPGASDDPTTGREKKMKTELAEEDLPAVKQDTSAHVAAEFNENRARGRTVKTEPIDVEEEEEPIAAEEQGHVTRPRTVKAETIEEIPISEIPIDENANLSQMGDSESSQSQWRQNKKRRRHISEDDDKKDDVIVSEPMHEVPAEEMPILPGFFSKMNRSRLIVKQEVVTSFESELPEALVVVKSVSLICQQPATKPAKKANGVNRNVKNFKNFRKSNYAGQRALPRIIGGSDLEVHRNMASQASQDVFLSDPQRDSDIDKAEALADELFSVEPKVRRVR